MNELAEAKPASSTPLAPKTAMNKQSSGSCDIVCVAQSFAISGTSAKPNDDANHFAKALKNVSGGRLSHDTAGYAAAFPRIKSGRFARLWMVQMRSIRPAAITGIVLIVEYLRQKL